MNAIELKAIEMQSIQVNQHRFLKIKYTTDYFAQANNNYVGFVGWCKQKTGIPCSTLTE